MSCTARCSSLYFFRLIRGAWATRVCSCTMSRMTKNAQKIYSRNPVLLSDLLGNVKTSKSQCILPALPEDTTGPGEGLRGREKPKILLKWLFGGPQGLQGCQKMCNYTLNLDLEVWCSNIQSKLIKEYIWFPPSTSDLPPLLLCPQAKQAQNWEKWSTVIWMFKNCPTNHLAELDFCYGFFGHFLSFGTLCSVITPAFFDWHAHLSHKSK